MIRMRSEAVNWALSPGYTGRSPRMLRSQGVCARTVGPLPVHLS
jgi:hypothetical protein